MLDQTVFKVASVVQIRSLKQLILSSFLVALIPLLALLWQTQNDLAKLNDAIVKETQFFVKTAGTMRKLEGQALDIERLMRQHFVLPNATLKQLNDDSLALFKDQLAPFCQQLVDSAACGQLHKQLVHLGNYASMTDKLLLDAHLASFKQAISALTEDVNISVDNRVAEQQNYMTALRQKQAWSTAALALLSLLLILFAAKLITKPVNKLKNIIAAIAENQNELPAKSSNGPRELIAVEKDLFLLHKRIQQLEKVRTALLRHASHELKTPLASFKEGCALLAEEMVGDLNTQQKEVVNLLQISTVRLNLLIEKLLDYNALLQQAEPSFEKLDVKQIVNECLTQNGLALQQSKCDIKSTISNDVQHIVSDAELFRRILDNLISNAVAHGTQGTSIYLHLYAQHNDYVLDVANHGNGISEDDRKTIFEPFKRGEFMRNDRVIGAGLGLSIVSDCARLLGGTVAIVEVDYAKVCFRIKLPQRDEQ
ncbi:HAMP domain-containing histidine kinase [Glaciecola sp. MH2013]|uniref:sensor histidine kinase n=1 Tax=Glaciecola sp. MH2013 TaxID=2785524 RepID=UPI00189DBFC2|nr:HAMP domain-containing sensor histidine kinase [Glaciecola sp. MH2013]MBF7073180.1 HAMP domain-containing histidine kinase [Glaciecola sp. MH2013]